MGRAIRPIAVVVEDDYFQCEQIREILEANEMQVVRCDSAEAAELVIARTGLELELLVTDVELAGHKSGLQLAQFARAQFPGLKIIVVSGSKYDVPAGMTFLEKPWMPIELVRELPPAH
jgi:two-component system, cell cycle response regulator CpdR